MTETMWPIKPKEFTLWLSVGRFACPRSNTQNAHSKHKAHAPDVLILNNEGTMAGKGQLGTVASPGNGGVWIP